MLFISLTENFAIDSGKDISEFAKDSLALSPGKLAVTVNVKFFEDLITTLVWIYDELEDSIHVLCDVRLIYKNMLQNIIVFEVFSCLSAHGLMGGVRHIEKGMAEI